ncbi:hypothetical protein [Aquabacterium sp.]|uniref:hypothetical protein n=1 Tax=Aquabacterium sp. TaxID=1872578 RepID=UPI0035B26DAA
MAKATPAKPDTIDDWQTEDDLRTLSKAEEIKQDPKRYKAALAMAKDKIKSLNDLQADASEDAGEEAAETK